MRCTVARRFERCACAFQFANHAIQVVGVKFVYHHADVRAFAVDSEGRRAPSLPNSDSRPLLCVYHHAFTSFRCSVHFMHPPSGPHGALRARGASTGLPRACAEPFAAISATGKKRGSALRAQLDLKEKFQKKRVLPFAKRRASVRVLFAFPAALFTSSRLRSY